MPEDAPAATPPSCRHHAVIVPDGEKGDQSPRHHEAESAEALLAWLYPQLESCGKGWCFVFLDGRRATLSAPRQVFSVKTPDGGVVTMGGQGGVSWSADNRFEVLRPR